MSKGQVVPCRHTESAKYTASLTMSTSYVAQAQPMWQGYMKLQMGFQAFPSL